MRKQILKVAAAMLVLLVLIGYAAVTYTPFGPDRHPSGNALGSSVPMSTKFTGVSSILGGGAPSWLSDNPAFAGNSSKIDYPPDYGVLANFTLGIINADRAVAGVAALNLSGIPSGQQHADSMAYYSYFSHWDNQGYKPYMRYSLLGGTGGVTENAAINFCNTSPSNSTDVTPATCSLETVEHAINGSEWSMVHNDTQCCSNGHRDNILDPVHDRVSIGIAYNLTSVYLVEDFEDNYFTSESLRLSGGIVNFSASTIENLSSWMKTSSGAEISVFFDPLPSGISLAQLSLKSVCDRYSEVSEPPTCQYQGAYGPGTKISTVFPPCSPGITCAVGNFTYAQSWDIGVRNFDLAFSISALEHANGNGVYTFYLWPTERIPEPITSLSVFVGGE